MKKTMIYGWIMMVLWITASPAYASMEASSLEANEIEWQISIGGSALDRAFAIENTDDGGAIVAGQSNSRDGDIMGIHSGDDGWVRKLGSDGNLEWQRCLGGTSSESLNDIHQTEDGGYIAAGSTKSTNGDFSDNHGFFDGWIVKLDADGSFDWQVCLGSKGYEVANSIQQTEDGGYIVAGVVQAIYDVPAGTNGSSDGWVVKLRANGELEWQRYLGGTGGENIFSIQQTEDGGYVTVGDTFSRDDKVPHNHGSRDGWIVKLHADGSTDWQACVGGSSYEQAYGIIQAEDGGYVFAGYTHSSDGDLSGNHGSKDVWVGKLHADGGLDWQTCFGGSGDDQAYGIIQSEDGGYVLAGYTDSMDGNISGVKGNQDVWIVKVTPVGNLNWQQCLGGSLADGAYDIQQAVDGGYLIAGYSNSADGDLIENHGSEDIWIVKLIGEETVDSEEDVHVAGRPKSMIAERSFGGKTLANFRDKSFGLLKVEDLEAGVVDYRAVLRSEKADLRLRIPYEDMREKQVTAARNLQIEYQGQVISIPMTVFDCEELLLQMPCQEEATFEIHLKGIEEGTMEMGIDLFVVDQVDEMTRVVHRATIR